MQVEREGKWEVKKEEQRERERRQGREEGSAGRRGREERAVDHRFSSPCPPLLLVLDKGGPRTGVGLFG